MTSNILRINNEQAELIARGLKLVYHNAEIINPGEMSQLEALWNKLYKLDIGEPPWPRPKS